MKITNLRLGNLSIIESGISFGTMNTAKAFYPVEFSREEIKADFLARRLLLGEEYGFDGHKMFMPDQVDKKGTYFEVTDEYVKANPNGWTDINQDILLMKSDVLDTAIGYPVADCAVLVASDEKNGVCGITHCSAQMLDMKIGQKLVDALSSCYGSNKEDINIYISACAGKDWTYDCYPKWATQDDVWAGFINKDDEGMYRIDLRGAIINQLLNYGIESENIVDSGIDTISDDRFYSNVVAHKNPELVKKQGRHFAGACFSSK